MSATAVLEFRRWCSLTLTRSLLGVLLDRTRVWLVTLVVFEEADGDPGGCCGGLPGLPRW